MNILLFISKIRKRRGGDLNSCGADAPRAFQNRTTPVDITRKQLEEFLSLREIENLCSDWLKGIRRYLTRYLTYVKWNIDKERTIEYLKSELKNGSVSTYRKKIYQIRRFLNYCSISWASEIKLPREQEYTIKRITANDIAETLRILEIKREKERYVALVLLGATSGLRSEELYQLTIKNIDTERRILQINHDPVNGQTTKTKKTRISFFSEETKQAIVNYLDIYQKDNRNIHLFPKSQCVVAFRDTPIRVKDLRKFFSQEWDRRGGPTSIKKILMGHSLKGDVDLMHYNCQSEEDLKKIYDKVMGGIRE
jgi:integrase/recombinase XerD